MCYCPTPTLHLNLALTGDGAFLLSPQKTHSVWFISVLNYGDTENVLINHLLLVIPMLYPCHYTNLCPHKPHKHAPTHTHTHKKKHTHTHTHTHSHTHTHTHTRARVRTILLLDALLSPHPLFALFHALHLFSFRSICFFSVFSVPLPLVALAPLPSVSLRTLSLSNIPQIPAGFLRDRPFWQTVTPHISLSYRFILVVLFRSFKID